MAKRDGMRFRDDLAYHGTRYLGVAVAILVLVLIFWAGMEAIDRVVK